MIWIRSHMDNEGQRMLTGPGILVGLGSSELRLIDERWEAITDCPTNGIRGSMQHIYTHAEHSTEAVSRIDKGARSV
jgi:hypothetical protein